MTAYTPADLTQVALIAEWRNSAKPPAYQRTAARNEQKRLMRDELTYSRYVGVLAPRVIGGQAVEPDEYLPAEDARPEDVLIARETERAIRASLTPRQNRILTELLAGLPKRELSPKGEIAAQEGVTPAIITREIKRIQATARQVVARLAE